MRSRTGGQHQQCFDCFGNLRIGDAIVPMPSLAFYIEQMPINQFAKMGARSLRRDIGDISQFASRQFDASHQTEQNRSPARIASRFAVIDKLSFMTNYRAEITPDTSSQRRTQ
jgi:hypothetical protein